MKKTYLLLSLIACLSAIHNAFTQSVTIQPTTGNQVSVRGYSASTPAFSGYRSNGTAASPTPVTLNLLLATLQGYGYNGTGFSGGYNVGIGLYASENFTSTANGADMRFFTTSNGTTSISERMRISHDGNVGIGTTTPNAPLQFSNALLGRKIVLFEQNNSINEYTGFGIGPGYLRYQIPNAGDSHVFFAGDGPNNTSIITTSKELMRIKGNGNVGIGTADPHAQLQLGNGAANRKIILYEDADNDNNFLGFGINNFVLRYQVSNTANNHVFYAGTSPTTSNELMRIQGNGNVGINIPQPLAKLHVNGTTILTDTSDVANVQIGAVDYTLAKLYVKNLNYQDGLYIDSPFSTGGNALRVVGTTRLSGNTQIENNLTVGGTTNLSNATISSANISNATIGALSVTGNLSKPSGSFKIDHPLDPENKILYHSFVESPDMMNVYNGNVVTDKKGVAIVTLPDYFEALNMDFRYQLTVIGSFSQAMIFEKVKNNQFKIKTQKPNVEVSWQVTGVRNDAYARKFRIPNTVEKSEAEKGKYLYPAAFDKQ